MRAPKAETGLLKPSNVKGLTDLLQIQAITGIGFSSLPASSSTCPIGLLSVFSRIKQSHSTASVYVGLDMGKQKKHLEGRLFTGFLAETESFFRLTQSVAHRLTNTTFKLIRQIVTVSPCLTKTHAIQSS